MEDMSTKKVRRGEFTNSLPRLRSRVTFKVDDVVVVRNV
jgi:hypothetical protein